MPAAAAAWHGRNNPPMTPPTLPARRRLLHLGLAWATAPGTALVVLATSGCSSTGATPGPTGWRAPPGQALLLGEVHDNAVQHALRARGLAELLATSDRPALLMEQFDRDQQPAIDALHTPDRPLADASAIDAQTDALVRLGGRGWQWPLYRPVLRLAVQHGLPLVAANLGRAEARQVIQQGLAATGWNAEVPADITRAQAAAIEASHCGQVDAPMAARLALAQVARDQAMARLLARHAPRGAVLLAGNGHVRADIGVPRWLDAGLRARTRTVGLLESTDQAGAFDTTLTTPAQARPDPCAGLRMPQRAASAAG